MADDFKYDVFLSHSAKDKSIVRPIAERLRDDGLLVWLDDWEIRAGDSIPVKIEEGLESSRVLVLCMSAKAFGSDWTQLESGTLRFRDPLNRERRFVPLLLDDAPIKDSLAQFLYIKWSPEDHEQAYQTLLKACRPPAKPSVMKDQAPRVQSAEKAIRLDTRAPIWAYAFSTDGRRVLTGSDEHYSQGPNPDEQRSLDSSRANTVRLWDLETGGCLRVFKGYTARVDGVALSADERHALSSGHENTVRLWDVKTGKGLRVFKGHTDFVFSVTWSADGRSALSGSFDHTVRLWDAKSGRCLHVLQGHASRIYDVAWSPDQRRALSASSDNTVRLWDLGTGQCLRVFEGHTGWVLSVAWSPDRRHAVSGSVDNTMRLWDVMTGHCLRVFEGHEHNVNSMTWSADQRFVLSGSADQTIRLWDVKIGRCLRVLKGHATSVRVVMWGADQHHAFSGDTDGGIRVWDLSESVRPSRDAATQTSRLLDQVQFANAKVLLVGDTGVGKSGLAERLVHKQFKPTKSSHARQAHVLESKVVEETSGDLVRHETLLWDLAGQPAYRSVHQLSMDEAALACVLFDSRSETNPFEGAAYWSAVLDQARTNTKLKKILVASRIDVGGLPASRERIEAFARDNGFLMFIPTSANTGEGCEELRQAILKEIPWADLPRVTTTTTLTSMRDYVGELKGEKRRHSREG